MAEPHWAGQAQGDGVFGQSELHRRGRVRSRAPYPALPSADSGRSPRHLGQGALAAPGVDQGPVHRETMGGKQAWRQPREDSGEKFPSHRRGQNPPAIGAEGALAPHRRIGVEPDEPSIEQVVVEFFEQPHFAGKRVDRPQQQGPQDLFRGRCQPAAARAIQPVESRPEVVCNRNRHGAHRAEGMPSRNPVCEGDGREKAGLGGVRGAHGQVDQKAVRQFWMGSEQLLLPRIRRCIRLCCCIRLCRRFRLGRILRLRSSGWIDVLCWRKVGGD